MRALSMLLLTFAAYGADWTKTYKVGDVPDIEIRCDDASIDVRPGRAGAVDAHLATQGIGIGAGSVEVIESQAGNGVRITVKMPRNILWTVNRSARLTLTVPPDVRLRADTGDGAIDVSGIRGDLRLRTGDGRITAKSVAGLLDAQTGDGGMELHGRFDSLRLHTGDGAINFDALPGSTAKSSWSVETGDGSIRGRLPGNLSADVDVRTGDGSVNVDLPGIDRKRDERDKHAFTGRLNGGGAPFRIRTGDGSVHLTASR